MEIFSTIVDFFDLMYNVDLFITSPKNLKLYTIYKYIQILLTEFLKCKKPGQSKYKQLIIYSNYYLIHQRAS